MSNGGEEIESTREAQAIAASAAALLRELAEEDVTDFDRVELPPAAQTPATNPASAPNRNQTDSGSNAARPAPAQSAPSPAKPRAATHATEATSAPAPLAESPAAAVPWADRRPTLDEVQTHLGDCRRCQLHEGRTQIVFGTGNPEARLMFVGEGPGEQEDKTGKPFVGRAGDLLTDMIEKGLGIPRSEVYICNIVKCRPPQNRTPLPPEVQACRSFLDGQIRAIAPQVIVTLGRPAASLLLDREVAITRMRGTWQDYQGIPLMPTLHPAFVLRQYTPENRRAVWEDLKAAHERSQA